MSRQFIIRPDVDAEIREIRSSLELARFGIGQQFVDNLEALLERIESHLFLYAILVADIRAVRVPKFAYVLYYFVTEQRIEVFAITHGARDTSSWLERR